MLIKLVEDIERAIEHECYFSALALALTLPDICGKAEYPELKVGERYKKWCQKYICPIRSKEDPYSGDMPRTPTVISRRSIFMPALYETIDNSPSGVSGSVILSLK